MITLRNHLWALIAMTLLTAITARAASTAETDLASVVVTPIGRQATARAGWQTIYDYAGGNVLPPGTRITADGKWIDPVVRKDKSGVSFGLPDLPDQRQAAQFLNIVFAVERPIANYPTRATIGYTSYLDQAVHERAGWWSPFMLTTADYNYTVLAGHLSGLDPNSHENVPIHLVGENTLVFSFGGNANASITMNKEDATSFFAKRQNGVIKLPAPGAMLLPGLALRNTITQLPGNRGNWFAINSFKIEQMRPPLEASAVAAVDLTVPGTDPVRATIEVVDANNDSKGYVLRDAEVAPGKYRIYWDGIDQKQSQPENTVAIGSGTYTIRLTTSKVNVNYVGDINNSTPKYNAESYGMVNCTAVALTPPGTTAQAQWGGNKGTDTRKLDATDSIQLVCTGYDAKHGQWIGADGTVIHTRAGSDPRMQHGRGLAVTPPDPADPTNPQKQFYFVSLAIGGGNAVASCSFPSLKIAPKTFASPDWNRDKPGFWPYQIHIGQLPDLLGSKHDLFFQTGQAAKGVQLQAEWVFRNIRLYEEGAPDPGPITFDSARFTPRVRVKTKTPLSVPPGSVIVEDNGHAVHLKNAIPVNYPFDYTITPRTILAFDVDVIDRSKCGPGNGIGLDADAGGKIEDARHYFNFLGQARNDARFGFYDPSLGAFAYPTYEHNTLYTDSVPTPTLGMPRTTDTSFLWQPGYYGLKVSEDGKLLFACNNADNRLEVRDISNDGGAIAKIPIDYPMFVTWAPEGAAGASGGTRYVYVDSPKEGLVRIEWKLAANTFGKPERLTPPSEFAYPRGIVYDAAVNRLFVCDTFTYDRSKVANQIAVVDPQSGKVISRFGKQGGIDPRIGGTLNEEVFSCPLTVDADSKGALWVNDYYGCEVRKYNYDPAAGQFHLERRVLGPNTTNTSHFYWMPGDPPTRVWTFGGFFVRNEADLGPDGRFTNQRATSATYHLIEGMVLRPYAHFTKVGEHVLATINEVDRIFEQVGDGWAPRLGFGENAGEAARKYGLVAREGEPPTALDKAIAAAGDADWEKRPWIWSDLNGNGKIDYAENNPEFKIAFGSDYSLGRYVHYPCASFRPDGAYVRTEIKSGGLLVIPPKTVGGKTSYDWGDAKVIPCAKGEPIMDVLAQDGRYYALRTSSQHHDVGPKMISDLECYDETGKLLWTRERDRFTLVSLQSLGDRLFSVMDRGGWNTEGPVAIRNSEGDLVCQVFCREPGDCWSNGALRVDADTAMIGLVQAYKVTGLSTVKTATTSVELAK